MNKKSAALTAGGVVASFAAGVAAVSFNWGLGVPTATSAANAATTPGSSTASTVKPIIKHRTITVHKKAPAPKVASGVSSAPIVMAAPPSYTAPVATTSGSHGGGESDGGDGGGD